MKRSFFALLLVCAMITALFAGCSKSNSDSGSSESSVDESVEENQTEDESSEEQTVDESTDADAVDYGSGEIKIWVADAVTDFTKTQAEQFIADHPEYAGYTITVEAVGEGDAASNMITDVEAGADIYGFAQDQLARLVAAGAIAPVGTDYVETVSTNNDAQSVGAATLGDTLYAYPIASDNGYFLYYDSSVVTDPTSLAQILADCEAVGKGFYMEINNGWYQPAFFFGAGCTLTYETDETGAFTSSDVDYANENGVAALKAMIELHKSSAFNNGSSVSNAANVAAIVDGTWDSTAAKELFGDNYACAKLPTVTVDDQEFQLSGFSGFKLMGVKPQTEAGKLSVCNALAAYLTSEEVQLARYEANGWGPSNLNAQQDSSVQEDEALSALREQLTFDIPQGQYPGDYWTLATSLGDSVIAGTYDNSTDEELLEVLQSFQETCQSYVG